MHSLQSAALNIKCLACICCRYTGHTLAKFIITMVSGILTGFFAVWMSKTVGTMFEWKNGFVQELLEEEGEHRVFIAYLWHAAYSCLLVSFAVALVSGMALQLVS
jgi:chloride channel 7